MTAWQLSPDRRAAGARLVAFTRVARADADRLEPGGEGGRDGAAHGGGRRPRAPIEPDLHEVDRGATPLVSRSRVPRARRGALRVSPARACPAGRPADVARPRRRCIERGWSTRRQTSVRRLARPRPQPLPRAPAWPAGAGLASGARSRCPASPSWTLERARVVAPFVLADGVHRPRMTWPDRPPRARPLPRLRLPRARQQRRLPDLPRAGARRDCASSSGFDLDTR